MWSLIKNSLKQIFSDVRKSIVVLVFFAIFGGTAGFLSLSETALSFALRILNTQTPLWATITVVLLLAAYIQLKINYRSVPSEASQKLDTKYFPVGNLIWETEIYKNNFKVIKMPICKKHDLRLINCKNHLICPYYGKCDLEVEIGVFDSWYSSACSYIDKEIRSLKKR